MNRIPPVFLFIMISAICLAFPGRVFGRPAGAGHVYGKIADGRTGKGFDYVTVSLMADTKDSLITGMLSGDNGTFSFGNLSFGNYRLIVSYEGYATLIKKVSLTAAAPELNMGNVTISETEQKMNEVTVTAERAASTLGVDKKVFNVDKDLSSRGGNALDVMQNLPGVAVDADGNVTLRNNTPINYVDGKPTTLTLDQIPSDQIDRVEVITNPSAKYEAAASGGIINVVMKHDTRPGYNGLITALAGTNDQYNGSAMINVHKGIIGGSLSANVSGATNPTQGYDYGAPQN